MLIWVSRSSLFKNTDFFFNLNFVSRETKESFVTKSSTLLEGTLSSVGDVSVKVSFKLTCCPAAQVKCQTN